MKRAIRFHELAEKKGIPYTRVHIARLEKAGLFPKHFNLGTKTIAWVEAEVDDWLATRINSRQAA